MKVLCEVVNTNRTTMGDLLACRVCLATGVKLYNMHKYNLHPAYENLTGLNVSFLQDHQQYLCVNCQHLLVKSNSFKESCIQSHILLKSAATEVPTLAQKLGTISLSHSPINLLSISPIDSSLTMEDLENAVKHEHNGDEQKIDFIKEESIPTHFEYGDDTFTVAQNVEYSEFENVENVEICETEIMETVDFEAHAVETKSDLELDNREDVEVIFLNKEQQLEEVVNRKDSVNYQNSYYKCELCYKGFVTDSTFKNHMARHDPNAGPYSCDICHIRWPSKHSLRAHAMTTHERRYICKICNHTSKSCHKAKEHIKWHQGYSYVCETCGAKFSKSTSHLTHVRLHHPSEYSCEHCGDCFVSQNGLNMHKKKAQCGNEEPEIETQYVCLVCKTNFKNMDALSAHVDSSETGTCDPNLSHCPQCGISFDNHQLLKKHLKVHREEMIKCEECNRTFSQERTYAVHYQRVHLGFKLQHKRDVVRPKCIVVCEVCGRECTSNAALLHHQRIHTGEKPFQCMECPKTFSVYQRLQIHMRTHTGERPFKCAHCPKAFKHKAALNRHNRVHTGVKPYECPRCFKSFSQSNSMKLHVRTVHLKLPAPYRSKRNTKKEVN